MEDFVAPERIRSADFEIRSYDVGDGALLQAATNASFDHLKATMPWAVRDQSLAEAEHLVRRFRGRYLLGEEFVLGIFSPDGDELLGGTGFHLREGSLEVGSAEIGMWIRAERAGRGLGTSVLCALLAWGFGEWPWRRLSWRTDTRNPASLRTAEKAGMQREGVLRSHRHSPQGERLDTVVFAALRDEWVDPG